MQCVCGCTGDFHVVKTFSLTLPGHCQISFFLLAGWLTKSRHLLAGPLTDWSVAIIVVRKQMWVHATGKKACLWLWSCASARYGYVCAGSCVRVSVCEGCGRVGFGKYDLAFPAAGFSPWLWVKCSAMSPYTVVFHHTHCAWEEW